MLAPGVVAGESDDVFQRGDDLEAVVKRRFTLGFDLDHFVIEHPRCVKAFPGRCCVAIGF